MNKDLVIEQIINNYNVSRETIDKIELYVECLLDWQNKFNLIGKSTIENVWERHILDSIQLLKLLPKNYSHLMDIGTGAGLPGFIIAICEGEEKDIYLVDSNKKKCSFLKHVAHECNIRVKIYADRIENMDIGTTKIDVITARAFSSIDNIIRLTKPYIHSKTKYLLQKGINAKTELTNSKISSQLNVKYVSSITNKDAYILDIEI
ncbi:MAG: 16S rRNA (guanine(527)-N(7))-methyltransferase RsmG [Rhizobiales bacterium]|nr:16S rRNA (guanine(527)-N(7))-methyltransferase RsmG [Hyphomicrobiales bacterium]MBL6770937.1 16S rRNA (guanine(527)-N(7))-methyltransferase RsmG [Hyphomicrobiales bacterium]